MTEPKQSPNRKPAEVPSESSRERLARRRAEMPIIDGARTTMRAERRRAGRTPWSAVWLRVLRPVAFAVVWVVVMRYAWTHFFGAPDDLPLWQQIAFYGVLVLLILVAMLALAPLRRREVERETQYPTIPATLPEMSDFARLESDDLAHWQKSQRLVVRHDRDGRVNAAQATDA